MNLLEEVRRKFPDLRFHDRLDGVKAAIRHVEIAERYLERGRSEDDQDCFNDVVYRSNQAFEGMLKEAYSAFHPGKEVTKLSPNEIEQYFIKSEKLAERVSTLFKNYRQQWRNPSTHDHTIIFTEQEAILAIASVSAFSLVLVSQIVEQVNFKRQQAETAQRRDELKEDWTGLADKNLAEQVVALLKSFNRELAQNGESVNSEAELVGRLSGFLAGLKIGIDTKPDVQVGDGHTADLILRKEDEVVVVEAKRRGRVDNPRFTEAAIGQLTRYLNLAKARSGIVYFWSSTPTVDLEERRIELDENKEIWVLGSAVR